MQIRGSEIPVELFKLSKNVKNVLITEYFSFVKLTHYTVLHYILLEVYISSDRLKSVNCY